MSKVFIVKINQLVPGMVLGEDLRHDKTGLVLIPKGTMIKKSHIQQLNFFDNLDKGKDCTIYDPSSTFEITPAESATIETPFQEMRSLPGYIASKTQKIYVETFDTVKQAFSKEAIEDSDVEEFKQAALDISEEIVRDPQILLQIAVLKAIDNYTFSHSINVAIYATTLAKFLNFSPQQLQEISLAGLLHDIGKLDIPREVVDKPGPLTNDEFLIMKEHARLGYERLKNMKNLSDNIIQGISQHHEKYDGSGYFRGLKGKEIHEWGRILATADVYDAVTTNRVYRKALLPHEGAEIVMGSGVGHLDYELVQMFSSNISFYPLGTKVILNTGEAGKVVDIHPMAPLRPVIVLETSGEVMDLSQNLVTFITNIVTEP